MPKTVSVGTDLSCYHCGDPCADLSIRIEDKTFCCEGCKMVYEILNTNELCAYYDLEKHPGLQIKAGKTGDKFAYLDHEEIVGKLIDFQDDQFTRATFFIPQIHCASCIWLLENLYKLHPGINAVRVNFLRREAYITFDHNQTSFRKVVELLATIGYEPAINLEQLDKPAKKSGSKSFTYKLGIAGFAFGNIMLMSFPEYLGLSHATEIGLTSWFGYLNLLLALPVFFYSSTEFFRSAWWGLRQGSLNIDVPVSIGIITLFFRSAYEIFTHTGAGFLDSLAGLVFFLLVGKWFQNRTYQSLSFERDYTAYFPVAATRKKGETESEVPLSELTAGDNLLIRNEGLIPADSVLMSSEAKIDYSFVTGESNPVTRKKGDHLYAGGRLVGAAVEVALLKDVSQSYLTQLWNNNVFEDKKKGVKGITDRFGKYFTIVVLLTAFASGIYWYTIDFSLAIQVFTAVLIVACPCALALAGPITLGNALRILGRKHLYLKHTAVVENMARTDHVVFDKTGTITKSGGDDIHWEGKALTTEEKGWIYALVRNSLHPVSMKIAKITESLSNQEVGDYQEIKGKGIQGEVAGHELKIGSESWIAGQMTEARSGASVSIDGLYRGTFLVSNQYREGIDEMITRLEPIPLSVLSGDNQGEEPFLRTLFGTDTPMLWNQSPEDKMHYIAQVQSNAEKVMMVGDGLNDAGALAKSDIGLAVSENIHHFSPACDGILDAKALPMLPQFIRFSKLSLKMVWLGIGISVLYNLIGLGIAIQGYLTPVIAAILMPVSSISAVIIGLVSTEMVRQKVFKKNHFNI
ncbi:MAG: heavy metal translocating P-type ATPase metal-binding domain-containing protein [Bacteroidetes bacterium]|nr:heavy metal translocating P-type ATPase metal-binding domain-containing protein [Bacteroidota bacterium]MCB0842872.1 heavy metal translocating P-type ATPase metal-binding domain-containing protein [Bacteroidota bacterium]